MRFLEIRGDHRRLEIGEARDLLRVDDDHLRTALAQPVERVDDLIADGAVAIIRDDDGIAASVHVGDASEQERAAALARLLGVAFIEAHHVLAVGNDPQFVQAGDRLICDETGVVDSGLA